MRIIILTIALIVSGSAISQNTDQGSLPEKTKVYFVAMGGAIYGSGEPELAAGLKFGFAKPRLGGLGPKLFFRFPMPIILPFR